MVHPDSAIQNDRKLDVFDRKLKETTLQIFFSILDILQYMKNADITY